MAAAVLLWTLAGCAEEPTAPVAKVTNVTEPNSVATPDSDPLTIQQVTAPKDPPTTQLLSASALDPGSSREVRYASIRQLEGQDPAQAVELAKRLLAEEEPFLRLNAIGVLARSDLPAAQEALAELPAAERQIAARLAQAAQRAKTREVSK